MSYKLLLSILAAGALSQGLSAQELNGTLKNVRRVTSQKEVQYAQPRWSPDGTMLAFTNQAYDGLWVMNADGANLHQISSAQQVGWGFEWSKDCNEILVRDTRYVPAPDGSQDRVHALWAVDLDGHAVRLTPDEIKMQPGTWLYNAAGTKAVAVNGTVQQATHIGALPPAMRTKTAAAPGTIVQAVTDYDNLYAVDHQGNRTVVLKGQALVPQVSPDGTKIAYCNMASQIIVIDADGQNPRIIAKGFNPQWAGNGQLVYDLCQDDGHTLTAGNIYLSDIATLRQAPLTNTRDAIEMEPVISPDGTKIAFTNFADGQIYIADIE